MQVYTKQKHILIHYVIIFLLTIMFYTMASAKIQSMGQQRPDDIGDQNWNSLKQAIQQSKLTADDAEEVDLFGYSVSISGNRALVGARNNKTAYIFDLIENTWTQTYVLSPTQITGEAIINFGVSVSLSGNRALIGSDWNSSNSIGALFGSAYVFEFSNGDWLQTAKLNANDASAGDQFGVFVSLSGSRALIGSFLDDYNGFTNSGSAYIFDLSEGNWSQTAKLMASDGSSGDQFGHSVSLWGDRALIGASPNESAYIFDLSEGSWSQTTILMSDTGLAGDIFGRSVSLWGDRVLIGANGDSNSSGVAYIFEFLNTDWVQITKLIADDGGIFDFFGISVSLSGDRAIIGAYGDDDLDFNSGAAYYFEINESNWEQVNKLVSDDGSAGDFFGYSVSLSGDRALIGAYADDDDGTSSGSAYLIDLDLDTSFIVSGSVVGLIAGNDVELENNGLDLQIVANGVFAFATELPNLSSYNVTVKTAPTSPNQTCNITGGSNGDGTGTINAVNVTDIEINCEFGDDLIFKNGFDNP